MNTTGARDCLLPPPSSWWLASSPPWRSACSRGGRTTIPNESEASRPLDSAHRISPKTPCRVELLGAPQGENGKRPRAYGFYSILSTAFRTFAARSTQYAAPLPAFTQSCFFPDIWLDGVRAGPFDHFSMRCEPNAAALARMTNELFQYPDA